MVYKVNKPKYILLLHGKVEHQRDNFRAQTAMAEPLQRMVDQYRPGVWATLSLLTYDYSHEVSCADFCA